MLAILKRDEIRLKCSESKIDVSSAEQIMEKGIKEGTEAIEPEEPNAAQMFI